MNTKTKTTTTTQAQTALEAHIKAAVLAAEKSSAKLSDVAEECKNVYASREALELAAEKIKSAILAGIPNGEKTLALEIDRKDKSQSAEMARKMKAQVRARVGMYWLRLRDEAFPVTQTKGPATRPGEVKDNTNDKVSTEEPGEVKTGAVKLGEVHATILAAVQTLQEVEDAPNGVDIAKAVKYLKLAAACMNGI